jgi:hypothetical protein
VAVDRESWCGEKADFSGRAEAICGRPFNGRQSFKSAATYLPDRMVEAVQDDLFRAIFDFSPQCADFCSELSVSPKAGSKRVNHHISDFCAIVPEPKTAHGEQYHQQY